jgi:hypothetical protein
MRVMNEAITKVCCGCKKEVSAVFLYKGKHRHSVYWENGEYNTHGYKKKFAAGRCHQCRVLSRRKKRNYGSRQESKNKTVLLSIGYEKAAEKRFADLGFDVERTVMHGPDLICKLGPWTYTVEVKGPTKCKRSNSWRVALVRPNRVGDDLMAMVLPNGYVYIDSMKNHLSLCDKKGNRTITSIVKEFGLSPLPQTQINLS